MDVRQSDLYAQYMLKIGWQVEKIDGIYIYIKKFPLIGSIIKIQRPNKLPNIKVLLKLKQKYHAQSISIEQGLNPRSIINNYQLNNDPYLPTKTIHIDLTSSEQAIFNRFSEAKRRAVRRAQKAGVIINQSTDINAFIKLKNQTAGLLGFLTTSTLKNLWHTFAPQKAIILLACHSERSAAESNNLARMFDSRIRERPLDKLVMTENPTAGILLLFHHQTAYYWIAASTKLGNKNFAPTLLVWETLKLAKQKGCSIFDFEGIFDERYPKLNKNWLGFTKFKQDFGGKEVYYSKPVKIT